LRKSPVVWQQGLVGPIPTVSARASLPGFLRENAATADGGIVTTKAIVASCGRRSFGGHSFYTQTKASEGSFKEIQMKKSWIATICLALSLTACSGMSTRDRDTVIGAGVGAAAGAALTHGDPIGTVGGAAVGGIIGNQVGR
jgi:osmotically inducible lipoprotein OsmB